MSAPGCVVCRADVGEEGDRVCARCAVDLDLAGAHPARCACGPCLVLKSAQAETRDGDVWRWREVVAVRRGEHPAAASLGDYLARRDAGATKTSGAPGGRGED